MSGEGAREEETSQGCEEGCTHESAAHPESGPHLESDTAALRGAREGMFLKKRKTGRGEKAVLRG